MKKLRVHRVDPTAIEPDYAHHDDSGADVYSLEDVIIPSIYTNFLFLLNAASGKQSLMHDHPTSETFLAAQQGLLELIEPNYRVITTGLTLEIPEDYEIQVRSKSGLASKLGAFVLNSPGTIDEGYRGILKVILANFGVYPLKITKGMKIAQMVLSHVDKAVIITVDDTARGTGGMGSTGLIKK